VLPQLRSCAEDALSAIFERRKRAGDSQGDDSQCGVQKTQRAATGERATNSRRLISNNIVDQYAVGGKRLLYIRDHHNRVIANFMTVCIISANAMASEEFRALQSFYCGEEDAVARSRLLLTRRKLRDEILPFRYNEALQHGTEILGNSSFSCVGYCYAIYSWCSNAHQHYDGWVITSPGTPAVTVGIRPVDPNALDAAAIARDWEQKLMIHLSDNPDVTQFDGFFFGLKRMPEAIISDSASVNVLARKIPTLRHENVYFGPCFAHFSALECADLLKSCKLAHVYPKSMPVLRTVRNSSSKLLPMLGDCMLKTGSKKFYALKIGVPTRWTTTWEAMCSLVRFIEPFALLMLTQKEAVNNVVRSNSQAT
jgi:hypothetical protein